MSDVATTTPADPKLIRDSADIVQDAARNGHEEHNAVRVRALADMLEQCANVELIRAIDETADNWIDAANSEDAPAGPHYAGMRALADYLAALLSEADARRLERYRNSA